jgi:hypothetical protein
MRNLIKGVLISIALLGLAPAAFAASVVVNGVIESPVSSNVTCTPVASGLVYPVAQGTQICPIAILPPSWSGAVTVDDTTHFQTGTVGSVLYLEAGATSPPVGPFSVTVTTTP